MRAGGAGKKGANFERWVANRLSERFAPLLGVEKGFLRNTTSGAVFGGKNYGKLSQVVEGRKDSGDILCPPDFGFSIECKNYAKSPLFGSFFKEGGNAQWDKWLEQAMLCNKSKVPLLVVKYNGCEPIVFMLLCKGGTLRVGKEINEGEERRYSRMGFYKGWAIFSLDIFLSQKDSFYFGEGRSFYFDKRSVEV